MSEPKETIIYISRFYTSWVYLATLLPFLRRQQSLSSAGGSPELNDSHPIELHGITINIADDSRLGQDLGTPGLGQGTVVPSRPDSNDPPAPRLSRGAKNKGVDADTGSLDSPFSFSGDNSSNLFSSRISQTPHSFTDHGSSSSMSSSSLSDINYLRASQDVLDPKTLEFSSSHDSSPITNTTSVHHKPISPIPSRPKRHIKNPIKIPRALQQRTDDQNKSRIPSNIFQQQELAKHVVAFTVALSPGVMILHHSSPKTMTWGMSVAVILLLSVGVAALWNSNLVQDQHPVCAHQVQMLGFALALAAFWGLLSCFLWNSYLMVVPVACWVVSAVILLLKAYSFKAPRRDFEHQ